MISTRPTHARARRLAAIAALALAAAPLRAQVPGWTKQAPLPTASNVMSIAAISPTELWGVASPMLGNVGALVHTTDAGVTWNEVLPGSAQLNAVFFVDAQHGWAAGNNFLHTTDGGQTWVKDNSWGSIYDLFFLDTMHGWACGNGGVAYYTTNGGLTWSAVSTPGGATMSSIWFTDLQNGWAVAINGRIVRSTDGGQSWSLNHDAGDYLSTIQFLDPLEGWAIGGDTFVHTLDGGQTWTPASVPPGTWSHGARFFDRLHGVSVGEFGNLVRTTDGGATWIQVQPIGGGMRLWDVEYGDATTVFYSGDNGALSRSIDGGATWASIQSGGKGITRAIDVLDAQRAWAANEGGEVLVTSNGGAQWVRRPVAGFDIYGRIHDVDFATATTGWAVGTNDYFGGSDGRISRSTDGGLTWQHQLSLPSVEFLGVSALSPTTALAYGRGLFASSVLLRTTDGGASWIPVTTATGSFRGGFFLDALTGWLVGSGIHHTTDGGVTWTVQNGTSGGAELSAVSFADALNGWAVGFANAVLHTTDGGQTWTPQAIAAPPLTAILGVTAVSPTTAWIAGWNGYVARTTDGGQTWIEETIAGTAGAYFECAEFLDAESGWVAGDVGIFKREATGGCPSPSTYCTAKVNSQGCAATLSWSGAPSASAGSGFVIAASQVVTQVPGVMLYTKVGPATTPFQGGFLCVMPPVLRVLPGWSGGAGACGGTFAVDFNTHVATGSDPGLVAGQPVWAQYWYRDPQSPDPTGLTNAIAFTLCP